MSENRFGAGNYEIIVFPSAARTVTVSSADHENIVGAKGMIITFDATVEADTASVTLTLQHKDLASGKYEALFLTAAAVEAVGTHTYIVYPANMTARDDVTETAEVALGRVWRITMTHADTDALTYTVGITYIL